MRDETIIQGFKSLEQRLGQAIQFIQNFQQAVRLDSTSKEIRLLAIQRLLIKKNHLTEAEITEASGDVIKEMQKQAEDAAKEAAEQAAVAPVIVPATPEQTAQVTSAPATEAAVKEVVPPQA
jgi:histone H3/H4